VPRPSQCANAQPRRLREREELELTSLSSKLSNYLHREAVVISSCNDYYSANNGHFSDIYCFFYVS
jgi:hypothetical protein